MANRDFIRRRQRAHRGARAARRKQAACGGASEREIKLEVPAQAWDALVVEMSGPDSRQLPLRAIYLDTTDQALSRSGLSLRVRSEGGRWVQTLKAAGGNVFERLEDSVTLGPVAEDGSAPAPDPGLHAAQELLRKALSLPSGAPWPVLRPAFEVRVLRRVRQVVQGGSVIEIALDEGELLAMGRSQPLRELELELVEGRARDLLALARRWSGRRGLWINTASKAARGARLASGVLYGEALGARPPSLPARAGLAGFAAAVLDACMEQVLANASEIAAGSLDDEHVHQLRVGVRRLRTALRELPFLEGVRAEVEPALIGVFRDLGAHRDRGHVLRKIAPLVEAAGGRPLRVPADFHAATDPGELVRGAPFQDALFGLLLATEEVRGGRSGKVKRLLRARLARLRRQVTRDGAQFTQLRLDEQHRVRKRLKRLRYLAEFAAPLYPAGKVEDFIAALKPAQDALGEYTDEVMAQALYQDLAGSDPGARFGVQWLQDRRAGEAKACRRALREFRRAAPFWNKR